MKKNIILLSFIIVFLTGCQSGNDPVAIPTDIPVYSIYDLDTEEFANISKGRFPESKIIYIPKDMSIRFDMKLTGDILHIENSDTSFTLKPIIPVYVYFFKRQLLLSSDNKTWKTLSGFAGGEFSVGLGSTKKGEVHGEINLKAILKK